MKISNIHIRIESANCFQNPFSFGFIIKEINITTTDDKWKKIFLDRTLKEN